MSNEFKVYVDVAPNMLRNPYTDRHQQLFGGFSLQVGDVSLPTGGLLSGEFLLVLLLHWNKALYRLVEGKSRGTKLFFTFLEGELWVRKTAKSLWKVSYIDYLQGNRIRAEVLCIPERLEVGLLSVSRKVLAGAQTAGIWTPDSVEMERFLRDPEEYMRQSEATTDPPMNRGRFAQQSASAASLAVHRFSQPHPDSPVSSRFAQTMPRQPPTPPVISDPAERRRGTPPIFCPRCMAVLMPWEATQTQQSCPLCRYEIRVE
jgi:hypothetical protein